MMPRLFAMFLTLLTVGSSKGADAEPLFNGKDLTGWTGDPKLWSVVDGAITGKTDGKIPENSFLIWNGTAGDFELRLKFRIEGNNSGIQYRSKVLKDVGPFVVGGYQADIDGAGKYTGILYEERGRGILAERGQRVEIAADGKKSTSSFADGKAVMDGIDQKAWNDYLITAVGNTLTHSINGRKTVEVIDRETGKRAADGVIALQLHTGEPTTVQFKDLQLKRVVVNPPPAGLSAADAPPNWIWLHNAGEHQSAFLRKAIEVPAGVTVARLILCADDAATVFIDGKEVLSNSHWLEPAFREVADKLSPGRHVIAVKARNEMSAAGVLLRLTFEARDREPFSLATDGSWKALNHEPVGWERLEFNDAEWPPATVVGMLGAKPWDKVNEARLATASKLREPTATPPDRIKVAKDFRVELLYSVPKDKQGSWVNMCADPKGRLYVSDQYGALYRIVPPPVARSGDRATTPPDETKVERVPVEIGEAQGMLWAFDSLYIVVNRGGQFKSGLYRLRDTNGDDQLDEVTLLRELHGDGEHGPHAVILSPDGQSLFVLCGNQCKMTELAGSRVPKHWGEDHLLPRMPDGRGFMAGVLGPGGCIYQVDRDGKEWTLYSTGYRNPYDIAFNRDGELFTYDADMEWDISTPWYRPTRVCHVVSGSDWGWRNGSGKWPPYFADTLPPVVDIGPGSPTGICFGYGAKFPAKYQDALFMCDWSYGKLYAVHLSPNGSTYTGVAEDFLSGNPLPLTDAVINPVDGAMYFTIGGRKTKSGLYRVTYVGNEHSDFSPTRSAGTSADATISMRIQRRKLETLHQQHDARSLDTVWADLGNSDRFIRTAARIALEHVDPKLWRQRALNEGNPATALEALLALVRVSAPDPAHMKGETPAVDVFLQAELVDALLRIRWDALSETQRLELLRIYQIFFNRFGPPGEAQKQRILAALDPQFPAKSRYVNAMLCEVLIYLDAPHVIERTLTLLKAAPTQEEQLDYAKSLRVVKDGWTPETRRQYFDWFAKAGGYSGGMSFGGFLANIRRDALANVPLNEATKLKAMLDAAAKAPTTPAAPARPFVRKWTVADLDSALATRLKRRDFDRGRQLFGAASCFSCHRFANEGGSQGPDLTQVVGRFSPRDLLESIIEPSKEISDQYASVAITTVDGQVITGRIINLNADTVSILPNMLEPHRLVTVDVRRIESQEVSKVSMMPESLLDTLNESEILDLMAYLLSRGERDNGMFKK